MNVHVRKAIWNGLYENPFLTIMFTEPKLRYSSVCYVLTFQHDYSAQWAIVTINHIISAVKLYGLTAPFCCFRFKLW